MFKRLLLCMNFRIYTRSTRRNSTHLYAAISMGKSVLFRRRHSHAQRIERTIVSTEGALDLVDGSIDCCARENLELHPRTLSRVERAELSVSVLCSPWFLCRRHLCFLSPDITILIWTKLSTSSSLAAMSSPTRARTCSSNPWLD